MRLCDLSSKARRTKLQETVNGVLRQIQEPITTADLVKRVQKFLGATDEQSYIAKEVQRFMREHPLCVPTGETFVKYGREMPRYQWLPNHKAATPDPETEWRRTRQRAIAAGQPDPGPWVPLDADIDAWTVHPEAVEDVAGQDPAFLEED